MNVSKLEGSSRSLRTLLVVVCWVAGIAISSLAPAKAAQQAIPQRVDWVLYARHCQPPPAQTISCGNYGKFYFGSNPGLNCRVKAFGSEVPAAYNLPGYQAVPHEVWVGSGASQRKAAGQTVGVGDGGGSTTPPPPVPPPPAVPCEDLSCLSPPGGADGQQPWMMILDWMLEPWRDHGLMMATLASQIFDGPVALFGVDDPQITSLLGNGVGDAHLLGGLCSVKDQVDAGSLRAPTVLSMSLGRFDQPGDADTTACDKSTLSCQLVKIIQRLVNQGTVPFAAAGNYKLDEFPGDLAPVIDVGNLDIAQFQIGEFKATWESPPQTDLLQPGSGVCIEWPVGDSVALYPTSPGTSFSTVIAAAAIGRAIETYGLEDPLAYSWQPTWMAGNYAGGGCFGFADLDPPYCNNALDRVLKRMLGVGLSPCWSSEVSTEVLDMPMPAAPTTGDLTAGLPGLTECFFDQHLPKPTSDLCIPCGMEESKSMGLESPGSKAVGIPIDTALDLVLDIRGAAAQEVGIAISGLAMRIGDHFYPLLDSGDPVELDQLAAGAYETLVIRNVFPVLPQGYQPSLLTFYEASSLGHGSGQTCWHSTPINLMDRTNVSTMLP